MINKELVADTDIKKESGFIYYCSTDEKGNIAIMRGRPTGRPGRKRLKREKEQEESQKENE